MIFTPLVKNKLASLLALLQSGCSTGNHSGKRNKRHLESLFSRAVINGGQRREEDTRREVGVGPPGETSYGTSSN